MTVMTARYSKEQVEFISILRAHLLEFDGLVQSQSLSMYHLNRFQKVIQHLDDLLTEKPPEDVWDHLWTQKLDAFRSEIERRKDTHSNSTSGEHDNNVITDPMFLQDEDKVAAYLRKMLNLPEPSESEHEPAIIDIPKQEKSGLQKRWELLQNRRKSGPNDTISSSSTTQAMLEREQAEQEALSDELARNAAILKDSASLFSKQLEKDSDVLAKAEQKLDENVDKLVKSTKQISKLTGTTWKTTCMIWLSILLVTAVFVFMFMFMRVFGAPKPRLVKQAVPSSTLSASISSTLSVSSHSTPEVQIESHVSLSTSDFYVSASPSQQSPVAETTSVNQISSEKREVASKPDSDLIRSDSLEDDDAATVDAAPSSSVSSAISLPAQPSLMDSSNSTHSKGNKEEPDQPSISSEDDTPSPTPDVMRQETTTAEALLDFSHLTTPVQEFESVLTVSERRALPSPSPVLVDEVALEKGGTSAAESTSILEDSTPYNDHSEDDL